MREILFRAKRIDNGEWAESTSICKNETNSGGFEWYIGARQPANEWINQMGNIVAVETAGECLFYACDPETIGQFTGLTDKNGKKIFEGDIVKARFVERKGLFEGVVIFENGCFCVKRGIDRPAIDLLGGYEVISNVYDNGGANDEL